MAATRSGSTQGHGDGHAAAGGAEVALGDGPADGPWRGPVVVLARPDPDGIDAALTNLGAGFADRVHLVELPGKPRPDLGPEVGEIDQAGHRSRAWGARGVKVEHDPGH